jgi:hypothetical protein
MTPFFQNRSSTTTDYHLTQSHIILRHLGAPLKFQCADFQRFDKVCSCNARVWVDIEHEENDVHQVLPLPSVLGANVGQFVVHEWRESALTISIRKPVRCGVAFVHQRHKCRSGSFLFGDPYQQLDEDAS